MISSSASSSAGTFSSRSIQYHETHTTTLSLLWQMVQRESAALSLVALSFVADIPPDIIRFRTSN